MPSTNLSETFSQAFDTATSAAKAVAKSVVPGHTNSMTDLRMKVVVGTFAGVMHFANQARQNSGFLTEAEKKRSDSATGWNTERP